MKTLSPELEAHYASGSTTLARLWRLTRRDGAVFGFTDHDLPIAYDGVRYEPSSAYDLSAVKTSAELNVDDAEVGGLLSSEGITSQALEYGLWDGAQIRIVEVNWQDLTMGHNPIRSGNIGEVTRSATGFRAELRGLLASLQNNIGRIITPDCDAAFGDTRCGVDIEALRVSGTVTSSSDQSNFVATLAGSDLYGIGVVTWTGGDNDGLLMEVAEYNLISYEIRLQLPMPWPIQTGDTFTIVPGCDKLKATCKNTYNNVIRFRGFSFVPGADKVLKVGGQ
jgi:uncharacterized phage protein (TIGR02218 family)